MLYADIYLKRLQNNLSNQWPLLMKFFKEVRLESYFASSIYFTITLIWALKDYFQMKYCTQDAYCAGEIGC